MKKTAKKKPARTPQAHSELVLVHKDADFDPKYIDFIDRYKNKCSIEKSTLATENAIWFGIDKFDPVIRNPNGPGWVSVPLPEGTLTGARMHLTQKQVQDLLPALQRFAQTGDLP
jgi:hypothetical protein